MSVKLINDLAGKGYSPEKIAQTLRIPLDQVTRVLSGEDPQPIQSPQPVQVRGTGKAMLGDIASRLGAKFKTRISGQSTAERIDQATRLIVDSVNGLESATHETIGRVDYGVRTATKRITGEIQKIIDIFKKRRYRNLENQEEAENRIESGRVSAGDDIESGEPGEGESWKSWIIKNAAKLGLGAATIGVGTALAPSVAEAAIPPKRRENREKIPVDDEPSIPRQQDTDKPADTIPNKPVQIQPDPSKKFGPDPSRFGTNETMNMSPLMRETLQRHEEERLKEKDRLKRTYEADEILFKADEITFTRPIKIDGSQPGAFWGGRGVGSLDGSPGPDEIGGLDGNGLGGLGGIPGGPDEIGGLDGNGLGGNGRSGSSLDPTSGDQSMDGPGGTSDGPGGGTFKGGSKNVESWMNFLMRPVDKGGLGLTPAQARGAVATMMGESGHKLNPKAFNPNDNGGPSGGTAQWHNERFQALQRFAEKRGTEWTDMETQQQYLRHEMLTSHSGVLKALRATKDDREAVDVMVRKFEVQANPRGEIAKRSMNLAGLRAGEYKSPDEQEAKALVPIPDPRIDPWKTPLRKSDMALSPAPVKQAPAPVPVPVPVPDKGGEVAARSIATSAPPAPAPKPSARPSSELGVAPVNRDDEDDHLELKPTAMNDPYEDRFPGLGKNRDGMIGTS